MVKAQCSSLTSGVVGTENLDLRLHFLIDRRDVRKMRDIWCRAKEEESSSRVLLKDECENKSAGNIEGFKRIP